MNSTPVGESPAYVLTVHPPHPPSYADFFTLDTTPPEFLFYCGNIYYVQYTQIWVNLHSRPTVYGHFSAIYYSHHSTFCLLKA